MTTLILPPRHTGDAQRAWRAGRRKGWTVKRAMGWRVEPVDGEVCVYGEALFVRAVADQLGLRLVEPPLDWLTTLPHEFLRRKVTFGPFGEVADLMFPRFAKPADDKAFAAKVYDDSEALMELPVEPTLPTLSSTPVTFETEFRCFVSGGEVVTLSVAIRGGEMAGSDEEGYPASEVELADARRFAEEVIADHNPAPACVVDVGVLRDGGWAVVEANPCWGSGFYGCPASEALEVVNAAVLSE